MDATTLIILAGLAFFLLRGQNMNKILYTETQLNDIYKKYSAKTGVDWKLIKAVAIVESSENPYAVNPSDPSYGLMQILFPNNLPAVSDWPPESAERLYDPDYNVHIGSQILAYNITHYGFQRGIATYNNWQSHNAPEFGPFPNEGYLNKVTTTYRDLQQVNFNVPDDIY